jgi:hypothetical protein
VPAFSDFQAKLNKLGEINLMQKNNFEESREHNYQFIEKMVTRGHSSKLHLMFQSKDNMSKSYMDAYNLVNEFIFAN